MIKHPQLIQQLQKLHLDVDQAPSVEQWLAFLKIVEQFYSDTEREPNLTPSPPNCINTEKMAIISQFSAGIAHEINNPLAYSLNNLDTLHKRVMVLVQLINLYTELNNKLQAEHLQTITDEMNIFTKERNIESIISDFDPLISETKNGLLRIKEIVKNLVKFAAIKKGKFVPIDVNAFIKIAVDTIRDDLTNITNLKIDTLNEPTFILGIAEDLQSVIVNCLVNANQAIQSNGIVSVSTKISENRILISITDNGCGISAENLPKIFVPFFTTKPIGAAIGLGLSTAYGIIELHGGKIEAESKENEGSTFTITLPIYQQN